MKLNSHLCCAVAATLSIFAPVAKANVTFNLIPEAGMPAVASNGFYNAASKWSSLLYNDFTVNLQIGYTTLGAGILGQASSSFASYSYSDTVSALTGARISAEDYTSVASLQPGPSYNRMINRTSNNPNGAGSSVPYLDSHSTVGMTTANAKALGLMGASATIDAVIRFNSSFAFDFIPGNGISAGQYDFVGVAMHEIGHALGFVSAADRVDVSGGAFPDTAFNSYTLDLFRYSTASKNMGLGYGDITADGRTKFFSIDGGATQLAGFSTGVTYGDGSQASHWKDNLGIGLMDPTAAPGELMSISANDLLAMDVIGYSLIPEPATGAILLVGTLFVIRRFQTRI